MSQSFVAWCNLNEPIWLCGWQDMSQQSGTFSVVSEGLLMTQCTWLAHLLAGTQLNMFIQLVLCSKTLAHCSVLLLLCKLKAGTATSKTQKYILQCFASSVTRIMALSSLPMPVCSQGVRLAWYTNQGLPQHITDWPGPYFPLVSGFVYSSM